MLQERKNEITVKIFLKLTCFVDYFKANLKIILIFFQLRCFCFVFLIFWNHDFSLVDFMSNQNVADFFFLLFMLNFSHIFADGHLNRLLISLFTNMLKTFCIFTNWLKSILIMDKSEVICAKIKLITEPNYPKASLEHTSHLAVWILHIILAIKIAPNLYKDSFWISHKLIQLEHLPISSYLQ